MGGARHGHGGAAGQAYRRQVRVVAGFDHHDFVARAYGRQYGGHQRFRGAAGYGDFGFRVVGMAVEGLDLAAIASRNGATPGM